MDHSLLKGRDGRAVGVYWCTVGFGDTVVTREQLPIYANFDIWVSGLAMVMCLWLRRWYEFPIIKSVKKYTRHIWYVEHSLRLACIWWIFNVIELFAYSFHVLVISSWYGQAPTISSHCFPRFDWGVSSFLAERSRLSSSHLLHQRLQCRPEKLWRLLSPVFCHASILPTTICCCHSDFPTPSRSFEKCRLPLPSTDWTQEVIASHNITPLSRPALTQLHN